MDWPPSWASRPISLTLVNIAAIFCDHSLSPNFSGPKVRSYHMTHTVWVILLQNYDSEIIERYEGIAQIRNIENTSSTSPRKTSIIGHGPGRSNVIRRKSVAKGLQMELMVSVLGIQKMFDQCSEEFFIALEDELGEALFYPTYTCVKYTCERFIDFGISCASTSTKMIVPGTMWYRPGTAKQCR